MNSLAYKASFRYGRSTSAVLPWSYAQVWADRSIASISSRAVVETTNPSMSSLPLTQDMNHEVKDHRRRRRTSASSSTSLSTDAFSYHSSLDLSDGRTAYHYKTNWELARAYVVFRICKMQFLVKHAESLLSLSRNILGSRITDAMMKATFFGHFCAGEDEEKIRPVIQSLAKAHIGGIFDYAAESDVGQDKKKGKKKEVKETTAKEDLLFILQDNPLQPRPVARVYDYESEARCDQHLEIFRKCIQSVQHVAYHGFAAVKITALGNPELLARLSKATIEAKNLFAKFDVNGDGFISKDEFEAAYRYVDICGI